MPINIDISKVNINNVLSSLKRDGIVDFKIIEDGVTQKHRKGQKESSNYPKKLRLKKKML